ncbi:uncharacterized protein PODANS_3_5570 [Podospora anserina S mat+]|uniref:Dehydrogenase/reductase SDR family member n=1 Tax=Podospora anserina (strain S / ATCC MYA-4624 / DSM 980 / FGSC 10383) TaxID=515849 RepID=B2B0G4_PODAN|nr:uncharacterized protein PODANS_3_5570 [Podospora anserina S mat+]CAP70486.1 unnamed protein product [Podospora anserina S mat+]CDP27077.1 Putative Dehydrogenase/reductase SDR family member [Podospora anserina S mat+]
MTPSSTSSASLDLGRPTQSATSIFISSQFRTKPQRLTLTRSTSLAGKTALITGATTGLGYHAAHNLLSLSLSHLIIAVRNTEKGEEVASGFRRKFPSATITFMHLEMSSYPSIQSFTSALSDKFSNTDITKPRLDIAILNAGVVSANFSLDPVTGNDRVIQVNYLGTFLLAILLIPIMRSVSGGNPGRLTIVSSGGVYNSKLYPPSPGVPFLSSFNNLTTSPSSNGKGAYQAMNHYFVSKLLGQMFFAELIRRGYLPPSDQLITNLVDPGFCKGTELQREASGILLAGAIRLVKAITARDIKDGAWTYVDAVVTKGAESNGCFVMDWKVSPFGYQVYEEGHMTVMKQLFEETMHELELAGIKTVLEELRAARKGW